ncbi:MAG: glucose-6-phosphate isomerase [Candidatus Marinimicrobia bacterium]|nr:glucose-6-phosphate isomerase [Candidatus Neomarinimicrobiota bacterium]MCF7828829.1 glucose-6-phosphate isomerase [Candidatus Neomarinimicrobiota bacterium]MCF7880746.1 glucose-6-phosphate isomerase [Candidatus Neomarinimicrobiota bacterium]
MTLTLDFSNIYPFIPENELEEFTEKTRPAFNTVLNKSGAGNDFLGWLDLPQQDPGTLERIREIAGKIQNKDATLVCIGIGGSYLGHKSVIEALRPHTDRILYAGQNISADHLQHILDVIEERQEVYLNPISKSGTTTEPGIAFRVLRKWHESRYGEQGSASRIVATTDSSKGALRELSDQKGYQTFVIPDDVGGRYSVLTPVGLFPIATAGIDIEQLLTGADAMRKNATVDSMDNPSLRYAAVRAALYEQDKAIEILSTFEPRLQYFTEWWKQLAGESEGKDREGLFPASAVFSTDLHSLGQWIQDGPRNIMETFLTVANSDNAITIEESDENADNLNYLAGKSFDEINEKAYQGTAQAHTDGGVPNLIVSVDSLSEQSVGALIYFFEMAVAITGYRMGVNPLNQPGVEAYKTNMFRLLGKPGVE